MKLPRLPRTLLQAAPLAQREAPPAVLSVLSSKLIGRTSIWAAFSRQGTMLKTTVATLVLVALFARDVRLLVFAGPARVATACATYCGLFLSYTGALALWLGAAHVQRPDLIGLSGSVWIGILSVHVVLDSLTWLMSRGATRHSVWVIALAPSPAIYLSLCFLGDALPDRIAQSLGVLTLLLFSVVWVSLAAPLAYELAHESSPHPSALRSEIRRAPLLNLSSVACLSILLGYALEGQ
jgi:hypothetical protein